MRGALCPVDETIGYGHAIIYEARVWTLVDTCYGMPMCIKVVKGCGVGAWPGKELRFLSLGNLDGVYTESL